MYQSVEFNAKALTVNDNHVKVTHKVSAKALASTQGTCNPVQSAKNITGAQNGQKAKTLTTASNMNTSIRSQTSGTNPGF